MPGSDSSRRDRGGVGDALDGPSAGPDAVLRMLGNRRDTGAPALWSVGVPEVHRARISVGPVWCSAIPPRQNRKTKSALCLAGVADRGNVLRFVGIVTTRSIDMVMTAAQEFFNQII